MTDSTDPGAVTHNEARGAVAGMAEASGWMAVGRKLERYIDQCESALTAMTARAEAAEAELGHAKRCSQEEYASRCAAVLRAERATDRLAALEKELTHLREATELLRQHKEAVVWRRPETEAWFHRDGSRQPSLPSTRLYGGKGMAVEDMRKAWHKDSGMQWVDSVRKDGVEPLSAESIAQERGKVMAVEEQDSSPSPSVVPATVAPAHNPSAGDGAADPPPEPAPPIQTSPFPQVAQASAKAWAVPEPAPAGFAASYGICNCSWSQPPVGANHQDGCPALYPEPAVVAKSATTDDLAEAERDLNRQAIYGAVRRILDHLKAERGRGAAPKVLPVEEFEARLIAALRELDHYHYSANAAHELFGVLAERLERGGEGKSG